MRAMRLFQHGAGMRDLRAMRRGTGSCFAWSSRRRIFCRWSGPASTAGRYHALGGRIAPLDHVGPEQLRIEELLRRIDAESPREVILALGADVEGEATANYLADLLREKPVTVTRIAQGLPGRRRPGIRG